MLALNFFSDFFIRLNLVFDQKVLDNCQLPILNFLTKNLLTKKKFLLFSQYLEFEKSGCLMTKGKYQFIQF